MAVPNNFKEQVMEGVIDLTSDTIKVALINDSTAYTFDQANHTFLNDILDGGTTAQEFGNGSGTGYGRQALSSITVTQDDTDNEGVFDAADVTFPGLDGATIQGVIIYQQVGGDDTTPGDDRVLAVYDDDSAGSLADLPLTANGSDVKISFASEGITNIT